MLWEVISIHGCFKCHDHRFIIFCALNNDFNKSLKLMFWKLLPFSYCTYLFVWRAEWTTSHIFLRHDMKALISFCCFDETQCCGARQCKMIPFSLVINITGWQWASIFHSRIQKSKMICGFSSKEVLLGNTDENSIFSKPWECCLLLESLGSRDRCDFSFLPSYSISLNGIIWKSVTLLKEYPMNHKW